MVKMTTERITLRIPKNIIKKLKEEKSKYAYTSLQEIILEALREKYFRQNEKGAEKRGRPKKINELAFISRKGKIFSKKGENIDI